MHILPLLIFVFLYNGSVFYAAGHPRCFFSCTVCWRSFQIVTYRFIKFFVSLSTLWTLTDLRVQIPALGTWTSSSLCLFTCTLRVTAVSKRNKWDTAWRVPSTVAGTQWHSMTDAYYIPLPRGAPQGTWPFRADIVGWQNQTNTNANSQVVYHFCDDKHSNRSAHVVEVRLGFNLWNPRPRTPTSVCSTMLLPVSKPCQLCPFFVFCFHCLFDMKKALG